jgi:serine palmitoyltransferase
LVDEGCSEPIRTGVNLSRSTVHYYKHNDMKDLANLLETVAKDDKKYKRDATQQRRFIVTEGLFHLTGDLCHLPELLKLRNKYCYRIILDETLSFGTIGATGRGVTEHYGVDVANVDIITVAMDTTLAGIGGGCVGTREVVDHQRLSGSGYCFSASAPPFLFAASLEALNNLDEHGRDLLVKLKANVAAVRAGIDSIPHLEVISDEVSAVVQLAMIEPSTFDDDQECMEEIADFCLQHGVAVVASSFDTKLTVDMKKNNTSLRATLRLNVSAGLSSVEIKKVLKELKAGVVHVMGK